jgi:tetrahydromethanopterin S-methyltransferase subunit G
MTLAELNELNAAYERIEQLHKQIEFLQKELHEIKEENKKPHK